MGVASKLRGVKGGHAAEVEMVADFRINSSIPPIPAKRNNKTASHTVRINVVHTATYATHITATNTNKYRSRVQFRQKLIHETQ